VNFVGPLASYAGSGAERAFGRLREALRSCTSYSGVWYAGEFTSEVTDVRVLEAGHDATFRRELHRRQVERLEEA
jgi:hypothetical protein